ncbi:MAG: YkgJ family cysteine cluster protein [Spirochaetes bacterium]|nr:YkgJ family cysteine cluster protein [Spirochaetota bacterium]MBN2771108.1 YkgJ family cysteine cluster protein [Spirochaetota bacterium]
MNNRYKALLSRAASQKRETKLLLEQLKRKKIKNLDKLFKRITEEIFYEIDCLDCGNCCRVLGPRINNSDMDRMSHYLGMRRAGFRNHYLTVDEDGDAVFKSMPCPFLAQDDNTCAIYKARPRACMEYPHTDAKYMEKKLDLVFQNSLYCPAVILILEKIKEEIK